MQEKESSNYEVLGVSETAHHTSGGYNSKKQE